MAIITALIDAGVDVNPEMNFHRPNAPGRGRFQDSQISTGTTALFRAVQLADQEVVELLLKKGANPNIRAVGFTAFGWVSGSGPNVRGGSITSNVGGVNLALMDLLAKHGADVNAKIKGSQDHSSCCGYNSGNDGVNSKEGTTSLHEAARNGRADLVKHLLELGANPNITDADGKKPVDVIGKLRAATAPAAPGARGPRGPAGPTPAALDEIRTLLQAASATPAVAAR